MTLLSGNALFGEQQNISPNLSTDYLLVESYILGGIFFSKPKEVPYRIYEALLALPEDDKTALYARYKNEMQEAELFVYGLLNAGVRLVFLFPPFNIGSILQGDRSGSIFLAALGTAAVVLPFAAVLGTWAYFSDGSDDDFLILVPFVTVVIVGYVVSMVYGLVTPFIYKSRYNKRLKRFLDNQLHVVSRPTRSKEVRSRRQENDLRQGIMALEYRHKF